MAEDQDVDAAKAKQNERDKLALERARRRFKEAIDAESENRDKELDDLKFLAASPDDNWQWPKTVYDLRTAVGQEGGPRPCLTINKLPQHHRQVTNEQKMNRPQIKVQPVDDHADVEVAEVMNGIIRHIQVASEADLAFDKAGDAQVAHGCGYFRLRTDYCDPMSFDQDILIDPLPDRFKVYMDPEGTKKHPAGKMCKWGFIIEDLPKEEYEELYGEENAIDWNDSAIGDKSDWFPTKDVVRVAEYFEIEEKPDELLLYEIGGELVAVLKSQPMPTGLPMGVKPVKTRKTRLPKCIWRKLTGQAVISEKEMPTKYIPIVRMVGNEWIVEGKPVVSGLVRNAKDACRMYNYNASLEVELNALAPRAPFVAMAEQIKGREDAWRGSNRQNVAVLLYNKVIDEATGQVVDVNPPARAQPALPQAAVISAKLAAGDDIKATTGQYDPSLGNQSNETSGKAINARKVQSEVGTFHYIDNYARALRYAGTIIVDMIPRVYDTKRIVRILGEDGTPDQVTIDPKQPKAYTEVEDTSPDQVKKISKIYNLGVGKYDVIVNVGPSFATQRQEAATMLTEMSQGAMEPVLAAVMRYLTVKNMDWAGAKEMADVLKKLLPPGLLEEPQADMPPQAKQMIDQLRGQLDQAAQAAEAAMKSMQERDAKLQSLETQVKSNSADALAKMYEADKKALAEIEKAKAEVMVARVNAVTALAQQPDNQALQQLLPAIDAMIAEMDAKITALAQSTEAIAQQLNTFEISARMPVTPQTPAGAVG